MTYDLLDDLGGGVQVDETLVDPHLESVPSLGTLTTGTALREQEIDGGQRLSRDEVKLGGSRYSRLPGGDLQVLGGQPDGSLDSEVLVLGPVDEVGRDYFTQTITQTIPSASSSCSIYS